VLNSALAGSTRASLLWYGFMRTLLMRYRYLCPLPKGSAAAAQSPSSRWSFPKSGLHGWRPASLCRSPGSGVRHFQKSKCNAFYKIYYDFFYLFFRDQNPDPAFKMMHIYKYTDT
jgi:hypothetical protein